jgi:SPP1 gp7 family putative phage head morphogenesis protein
MKIMTTENKKKIDEYWTERALQQEHNAQIVADRYMAQIGQSLADYKHQLLSEIEKFYARYAVDNKMTHAEAKQYLTDKERREFKHGTLERFREMALNPDTPTPLLDALGYRHRISRKEALLAEIERLTAELYGKPDGIHDKVTEALSDVYIKGKIHQAKNLAHFGIIEKPILGVDAVKHKMGSNWSGKTFSENVWVHKEVAYKAISDVLNKGLTGGWSIDRMARALSERTGVAYHRADTLVRTETTFYNNLATLDTIKELGGDHYEIVAVLDSRTSEICRLENHEVHSVKEYEPGRTAPPFHVRCRSTIRPAVKSDKPSPYFDILQNDSSVKLATEKRSLDEIFAGWEREGEAVLRGVKESEVVPDLKPNEIDDFFRKQKSYQKWLRNLSSYEAESIHEYTTAMYEDYNHVLRVGKQEFLDKISGGNSQKLSDETKKWYNDIEKKSKQIISAISTYKAEKTFKTYRLFNQSEDNFLINAVGKTLVIDKGFMSTSLDRAVIEEFGGGDVEIQLNILIKKGQSVGAYVSELSNYADEKEFVIKPNTRFKVLSETVQEMAFDSKRRIFEVEVVE